MVTLINILKLTNSSLVDITGSVSWKHDLLSKQPICNRLDITLKVFRKENGNPLLKSAVFPYGIRTGLGIIKSLRLLG